MLSDAKQVLILPFDLSQRIGHSIQKSRYEYRQHEQPTTWYSIYS